MRRRERERERESAMCGGEFKTNLEVKSEKNGQNVSHRCQQRLKEISELD